MVKLGSGVYRIYSGSATLRLSHNEDAVELSSEGTGAEFTVKNSAGDTYSVWTGNKFLRPNDNTDKQYKIILAKKEFPWSIQQVGTTDFKVGVPDQNVYWFNEKIEGNVKTPEAVPLARAIGNPGEIWRFVWLKPIEAANKHT